MFQSVVLECSIGVDLLTNVLFYNRAVLLTIPLMLIYGAILVLTGTVLYSYFYVLNCDPLEAGFINNSNQASKLNLLVTAV